MKLPSPSCGSMNAQLRIGDQGTFPWTSRRLGVQPSKKSELEERPLQRATEAIAGAWTVTEAQELSSPDQSCLAAFLAAAFFCRRGNRGFFFLASFGTLGFGGFVGFATPMAVAIFPAASPTILAAVTKALSGAAFFAGSAGTSVASFFFGMPAYSTLSDSRFWASSSVSCHYDIANQQSTNGRSHDGRRQSHRIRHALPEVDGCKDPHQRARHAGLRRSFAHRLLTRKHR